MIRSFVHRMLGPSPKNDCQLPRDISEVGLRRELLHSHQMMLSARIMVDMIHQKQDISSFRDVEFKCFSQFGDDGIIQYLIQRLKITERTFVEFGVEDYTEANTRFLLMNDNWRGLILDGSYENMDRVRSSEIYWKHNLTVVPAFIDTQNINSLIEKAGFSGEIGILSVDIDGNDYWVWEAINIVNPVVVIVEYNSVLGKKRPISIPYDPMFVRSQAHFSHLYWGASIPAFCHLANQKGYAFAGCNSAGNNAYFVQRDRLQGLQEYSPDEGFVESKFRESRSSGGEFSFLSGEARLKLIRRLPVINVTTGSEECI